MNLFKGSLLSLVLFGTGIAAEYNWKLQSFWSGASTPQTVIKRFAQRVNEQSDGKINITVLPNKAIVPHNQSIQAVGSKILELQKSTPCYFSGLDAAFGLLCDLNTAYDSAYDILTWYYQGGGLELARELYAKYNLYYIGPVPWGVESIPTKKPIRNIADFKGVKLRMPEGPSSDLFKAIGAAPVNVHGSEVYTSLDKGVIEATDWSTISTNDKAGLHKVAKYAIYPGIHSVPAGDVSINLDLWNKLPKDLRGVLETNVRVLAIDLLQTVEKKDAEVLAQADAKGITLINWSGEERKKLRGYAKGVWEKYASKSAIAKKVYDSHIKWLTAKGSL